MKGTEQFKAVIKKHLKERAASDPLFAETFKKEKKSLDECVTYILNTVKASGCTGFADEEIFGMAAHYYDEDDIKPGKPISSKVIVNHSSGPAPKVPPVELTEEDKQQAKQQAIERTIQQEQEKLKKKPAKKKDTLPQQPSLFD